MDIARAIHKIDAKSRYLLNHAQADGHQEILEWRGPGPEPSPAMLSEAWRLCQDDDIAEAQQEIAIQKAILRIKASPTLSDVGLVLRL